MSDQVPALDPKHTALLVMDFQRGLLRRMPGLEPLLAHEEDPATAIHDSLAPQPGDIVVRKTRVGAMSTTDLDRQLRDRGIDTLVLAGISTSGVVLSTLVEAADRDYRLYVLSDGTEDPDEQTRDVLLGKVFPRRAQVIDTGTLRALLSP